MPLKTKKIPLRTCVACGKTGEKKDLIRVVRNKEGQVFLDKGKSNGRGAYLCNSRECLEMGLKKKSLAKALDCTIPDEVTEELLRTFDGE